MTPKEAVTQLAEILAQLNEFTEDNVYEAMAAAGIPDPMADRVYKFTQIAWGRLFLSGLGVKGSPDYICFNASGEVAESGKLEDEAYYNAACELAPKYAISQSFQRLALMSADVHAVNELLHRGSRPENLVTSSAFLFLEPATDAGMQKAQQTIAEHAGALKRANPVKKPWWQFWK